MILALIGIVVLIIVGASFVKLRHSPPRKLKDEWMTNDYEVENEKSGR